MGASGLIPYSICRRHQPRVAFEGSSLPPQLRRRSINKRAFEGEGEQGKGILPMVARWQNLIPSFPWIAPWWRAWGRNPRKGRDQILQRNIAQPYCRSPKGQTHTILKIRL